MKYRAVCLNEKQTQMNKNTRWWFQRFSIFNPKIGGNDPI